jgi:hypothetical protein
VHSGEQANDNNEAADAEAQLYKSRAGYASVVTRRFNEFSNALQDSRPKSELQGIVLKLDSAFWAFKSIHVKHMKLVHVINHDRARYCEIHLSEMSEMVQMAHQQYDESFVDGEQGNAERHVLPGDSVSQVGSSRKSTTSSRVKAAAKKAGIQAKLNYLKDQEALHHRQLELD